MATHFLPRSYSLSDFRSSFCMLNVPASACRQRLLSFYSPNNGVELIGRPPTLCPGGSRGYPNGEQEKVRLHLTARFRFVRRTINFNPDHVSSIAHTLTSTNPSGSAAARTTSSVTSVAMPEDFSARIPELFRYPQLSRARRATSWPIRCASL